ncbi:MAG TPA: site-specific integrase [Roseiflexaceae bacterium]|nr:site-specific integrase [Roseiflexaceae bacterium]
MAARKRKRRSPGTGTIRPLPGGRAKASYPDGAGGHWTRNFDTVAQAEAWLDTFAERKKARQVLAGGQQPLGSWLQTWLDTRPAHLKPTTLADYAYKLGYLAPLADLPLVDLTADTIDDLFRDLARTVADTTLRQARSLLTRALKEAQRRRYIVYNVAEAERTSRPPVAPRRRLSAGNARALTRALEGDFYELAFWLILCCGLRAGEVCGLRRVDLDLEAATLTIAQQYTDVAGKATLSTPKTASSARTLPFPRALLPLVRAHLARLDIRARRALRRGTWQEHGLVFPGRSGRPMNPTSLRHALRDATDAANLPPVTAHELRHTCAGILESLEAPEYIIAGILGHGPKVITRHYAPPSVPTMRTWVDQVHSRIADAPAPLPIRKAE